MKARLNRFMAQLAKLPVDAMLITDQHNIYYLTGFWGSAGTVFISPKRQLFLTDARYTLLAKQVVTDFEVIETRSPLEEIKKIIAQDTLDCLGFERHMSYAFFEQLTSVFERYGLVALDHVVETLRQIKDETELALIKKACQISDQAFLDVLDWIRVGETTELAVANFLDFRMRELGASGVSFETIVASGKRSAMPHGVATDAVIQAGDSLTLDFGCIYQHYVSDMTRTVHVGHVTDEERDIYDIVLRSNQALISAAKAGMTYRDYDGVARSVIEKAGYGSHFTHGIGNCIGLDIHEIPFFGKSDKPLQVGMVVTDEPGIYLDNRYGVRIEDDLVITADGCEVLTQAPKELIIL